MAAKASATGPAESQARAEANFKKEERARDGAQAMLEYLANGREIRANMAKLKALRLAREAAGEAAEPMVKVEEKGAAKVKTPRALKRTHR